MQRISAKRSSLRRSLTYAGAIATLGFAYSPISSAQANLSAVPSSHQAHVPPEPHIPPQATADYPDAPSPASASASAPGLETLVGLEALDAMLVPPDSNEKQNARNFQQAGSQSSPPPSNQTPPSTQQPSSSQPSPPPQLNLPPNFSCELQASTENPQSWSCQQSKHLLTKVINSGDKIVPLTPTQKLRLAAKNVIDPFNLLTVASIEAISVASDPDSAYGPGFPGFGRAFGTSMTENINGEFWGTFVIPSIFHQDPHYHRLPGAPIKRRVVHVFTAVLIGRSDDGKPMFNYAEVLGYSISAGINNLYVPYSRTNVASTTERVVTSMAFDPIGNAISEFVPDLSRRVNIKYAFLQRIVDHIAQPGTP